MPSIAPASSQPISGFSGFPKLRQSVSAERLPARAGDVARGFEDRERAADEGIEPCDPSLPVEREREAAERGAQA